MWSFLVGRPFLRADAFIWVLRPLTVDKSTLFDVLQMARSVDPSARFYEGRIFMPPVADLDRPLEDDWVRAASTYDLRRLGIRGERLNVSFVQNEPGYVQASDHADGEVVQTARKIAEKLVAESAPRIQWRRRVVPLAPWLIVPVMVAVLVWLARSIDLPPAGWVATILVVVIASAATIEIGHRLYPLVPIDGNPTGRDGGYLGHHIVNRSRDELIAERKERRADLHARLQGLGLGIAGTVVAGILADRL